MVFRFPHYLTRSASKALSSAAKTPDADGLDGHEGAEAAELAAEFGKCHGLRVAESLAGARAGSRPLSQFQQKATGTHHDPGWPTPRPGRKAGGYRS
jgi:hypothetical protein